MLDRLRCLSGPRATKHSDPLTPSDHLADHGVFDLRLRNVFLARESQALIEGDNGEDITVRAVAQGRRRANIGRTPDIGNIDPAGIGDVSLYVCVLRHDILVTGGGSGGRDVEVEAVMDDQEWNGQVEVLAYQDILLDLTPGRRRPAQLRE